MRNVPNLTRPLLASAIALAAVAGGCRQAPPPVGADGAPLSRFAASVTDDDGLGEYPRPTMRRDRWVSLNGPWEVAIRPRSAPTPTTFDRMIRVPFPIESPLSGVGRPLGPEERIFYRREVTRPEEWVGGRVLLHFGAVDWECEVSVGGEKVGWHRGGYDAFTCDVTDALVPGEPADVVVAVWDPTDAGGQPRGPQSFAAGTAASGIWQTVWLEPVPEVAIDRLVVIVDDATARVAVATRGGGRGHTIRATAVGPGGDEVVATARFDGEAMLEFDEPRLWSPGDPYRYDLSVELRDGAGVTIDAVSSAVGLRAVTVAEDEDGVPRIHLNGRPVFWSGVIDDGLWPGGAVTAPSDEALLEDLRAARELGFAVVRKRGKVEPERWYAHCDRLGVLVFQDLPAGTNASALDRAQWRGEVERIVRQRSIHPSVVMWIPFDEGRGAHDVEGVARWLKSIDPTRLVDASSGAARAAGGDVVDVHGDPAPRIPDDAERAVVIGAFGAARDGGAGAVDEAIESLWRAMHAARGRLSAAIWEKLTDGPNDATGLRTFDRGTMKVDAERLSLVHAGLFPPVLARGETRFFESSVVELESDRDDVDLRYTIDGTLPGVDAPLVDAPLAITESCVLTARAFDADGRGSWPVRFSFERIETSPPLERVGSAPGVRVRAWVAPVERFEELSSRPSDVEWASLELGVARAARAATRGAVLDCVVLVPRAGSWRFPVETDAPFRLLVDGEAVTDSGGATGIALATGPHRLRLELLTPAPLDRLAVHVEGPDVERQVLPTGWLTHDP